MKRRTEGLRQVQNAAVRANCRRSHNENSVGVRLQSIGSVMGTARQQIFLNGKRLSGRYFTAGAAGRQSRRHLAARSGDVLVPHAASMGGRPRQTPHTPDAASPVRP